MAGAGEVGDRPADALSDLDRHHHLDRNPLTRQREHAVRAHLLQQTGDGTTAAELFRRAADLTGNQAEQRYLRDKADRLDRARRPPAD
ncbi:hypothetical protein NLM24_29240 [Nocardia zapadnayensis]|uniref:hypothetical protein n=1 Tax=Nocardia rhamnosiphila TaxID=426716 RepID=UPI00224680D7|nr:hypothetical protein [Nocardia zapadnayensis]MCX0274705.1 hypothetical protein [Nocardia zapadnayensis]